MINKTAFKQHFIKHDIAEWYIELDQTQEIDTTLATQTIKDGHLLQNITYEFITINDENSKNIFKCVANSKYY